MLASQQFTHRKKKKDVLRFAEYFEKKGEGKEKKAVFSLIGYPGFCPQQEAGGEQLSGKVQPSTPCPGRDAALASPAETAPLQGRSTPLDLHVPRAGGPGTPK